MSETPSWLQSGNETPAPAPAAPAPTPVGSLNVETNNNNTISTTSAAEEKDLPAILLMMRLLNMGVAGAIIAISVRNEREKRCEIGRHSHIDVVAWFCGFPLSLTCLLS